MNQPFRKHPILTLAASLAVLLAPLGIATASTQAPARVLAIGDIHGEFNGLVEILEAADLINDRLEWTGGETTLVQTGDFVDRGKDVRRVMDLLMSIQAQAADAGGQVVVLLGNHEQLNMVGELRPEYVTADICAAWADESSAERRHQAYLDWVAWQKRNPFFEERSEETWNELYPLGYFEYVDAIGPDGEYGRWLRTLPVATKIGSSVFLHGGIGPDYASMSIAKINKLYFETQEALDTDRAFLARRGTILPFFTLAELNQSIVGSIQMAAQGIPMSEHEKWMFSKTGRDLAQVGRLLDAGSPLWFRGYYSLDDSELGDLVAQLNREYDTKHYVVAHTVQPSASIWARLDGSIFLIDTGMLSSHYGGRPSALEISDGRFTAIYPNDRTVLYQDAMRRDTVPAVSRQRESSGLLDTLARLAMAAPQFVGGEGYQWIGADGEPLPFDNTAAIENFLENAEVVDIENIPVGVTRPKKMTLEMGGIRAKATFREVNETKQGAKLADGSSVMFFRDNYMNEVAAYELGKLLGLTNIPPAVVRTINGNEGSLQLWVGNTITEKKRIEEGKKAPDVVRFRRQVFDMDVFDALINNLDRNQGNILWDQDWNLWMIDHTRAFNRDGKVRTPDDLQMVSQGLLDKLRALDPKELKATMKPYVPTFELSALVKRQKDLLKILDGMIEKQGKDQVVFEYE